MIKAGVIGNPISHSKSPRLHNHWLTILGIHGKYYRLSAELEEFDTKIQQLMEQGFSGINVTIPFKLNAYRMADKRSKFVEQNGAANTLVFQGGIVEAHNTDGYGFAQNIFSHYPDWNAKGHHVILGAGGAAKAIVTWLYNHGANSITVVNRTIERAQEFTQLGSQIYVANWNELPKILVEKNTLVNTTSRGMNGENDIDLNFLNAPRDLIVNDIVYSPLETGLIKNARAAGLRTVDGLGMLLWQARPGFEAWFGQKPPKINQGLRNLMLSNQIIALTGSIGVGKSTVAAIFKEMGFEIWEADKEVTKLYDGDDELYSFIQTKHPPAVKNGFKKNIWRDYVFANPRIFPDLEALIHKKIANSRRIFLESDYPNKLCDIPLLFETEGQYIFDKVITVSALYELQLKRVLARKSMSERQFKDILAKQLPDEEKRRRADFVIDNSGDLVQTRMQVENILKKLGVRNA